MANDIVADSLSITSPLVVNGDAYAPGNNKLIVSGLMTGQPTGFLANYAMINVGENISLTDPGSTINGFYTVHNCQTIDGVGPGEGSRNTISAVYNHLAATPGQAPTGRAFYTGIFSTVNVQTNDGGTPNARKGDFYGWGSVVTVKSNVQDINGCIGGEFDVAVESGATLNEKVGLQIIAVNGDAAKGSVINCGLMIAADNSCLDSGQFDYGVVFGRPGARWHTNGTLIGSYPCVNPRVANVGVDFRGISFTDSAFRSNGFYVDKSGNVGGQELNAFNGYLNVQGNYARLRFYDTQSGSVVDGSLWRLTGNGAGGTSLQINTAAAGDFSTVNTGFAFGLDGGLQLYAPPRPAVPGGVSLGTAANPFSQVYATTGAVSTSDARLKSAVTALSSNELAAARALAAEIGGFQFLSAIAAKGEAVARRHIGMTVQRAIEIIESHGLDPFSYAFICHDAHVLDERQSEVRRGAGDVYSFRCDQLLAFIIRGQEERLRRIEAAFEERS